MCQGHLPLLSAHRVPTALIWCPLMLNFRPLSLPHGSLSLVNVLLSLWISRPIAGLVLTPVSPLSLPILAFQTRDHFSGMWWLTTKSWQHPAVTGQGLRHIIISCILFPLQLESAIMWTGPSQPHGDTKLGLKPRRQGSALSLPQNRAQQKTTLGTLQ